MSTFDIDENLRSVFGAAERGDLNRMRQLIHDGHWLVADVVSTFLQETTLLMIACKKGFPDMVRYLIDECDASVERNGNILFGGQDFSNISPLWCAASIGHLMIVKMLIHRGASLFDAAEPIATPLHIACINGHYDVVKYLIKKGANYEAVNYRDHTCLMIASVKGNYDIVEYLLQHGTNIDRQNLKGMTALHYAARSEEIEICHLLLECGAQSLANSNGFTPLLSAAVKGRAESVKYFLKSRFFTLAEKVNALELLGATFVDKFDDQSLCLRYWTQAMLMRYHDKDSPLLKPLSRLPFAQCINVTEVSTLEELPPLISNFGDMQIQALLMRERILGPTNKHTLQCIYDHGVEYSTSASMDRCITCWMHVLDLRQVESPLGSLTSRSFLTFLILFRDLVGKSSTPLRQVARTYFDVILKVFQRATKEIERTMTCIPSEDKNKHFRDMLIYSVNFICLICKFQQYLSNEEIFEFKQAVYSFVHLNPVEDNGSTPLHFACCKISCFIVLGWHLDSIPVSEVIELLLEVGASPNAVNEHNNTPLHIAASNKPYDEKILKVLLNHGAHLDFRNKDGLTAFQLYKENLVEIVPFQYLTLKCHCAQVIRTANIPFKGQIPKELEEFVEHH